MSPLPPLPQLTESSDSFTDGYNRGFIVGQSKRDRDDSKQKESSYNNGVFKFNPYIPQLPKSRISPEMMAEYNAAQAEKFSAGAAAIIVMLAALLTVSPEQKERRANLKLQHEREREQRKIEVEKKRDEKRLIIGTQKYLNHKKGKSKWLALSIATGSLGAISFLEANNYTQKYSTATSNATALRKTGNMFYSVTPILISTSVISLFESLSKSRKLKNAKPPKY